MRHAIAMACIAIAIGASRAGAAPLPFEATLSIEMPGVITCLPDPPPGEVCRTNLHWAASVSGSTEISLTPGGRAATLQLAAGIFHLAGTYTLSTPTYGGAGLHPLKSMLASASNASGHFGPTGGAMPLAGFLKICMFGSCDAPPPANLSVPLSAIGAGGSVAFSGAVNATVVGAPWTTGTISAAFGDLDPTQVAGSAGPGSLSLVTPIYVSTNIASMAVTGLGYARLTVAWVPEPATALLLALGCAALVAAGRRV